MPDEVILDILNRLLYIGFALVVLLLTFPRLPCDLAGMTVISLDTVFGQHSIDLSLGGFVQLLELFLQLHLLLIEGEQFLLDEGVDIDLHVVRGDRVVIVSAYCREWRQVSEGFFKGFWF